MENADLASESSLGASVEELRKRFPRTQELYREVCVLLFFRHGITPTANKLYQLVRKGSMAAPTEALNRFWSTLRERSRVMVEHADLPDELKTEAGDMVAALWKSAQAMSHDALTELRLEASGAIEAAKEIERRAQEASTSALNELEHTQARVHSYEDLTARLRNELSAASATRQALEARLEECGHQLSELKSGLDRAREEHTADREKLAERTLLAERRFADMEKRALSEIDRERTLSTKLQKAVESERTTHTSAIERLHADQNQSQITIGELREQNKANQRIIDTLTKERNREQAELQSTRAELQTAMRQDAIHKARDDLLSKEVDSLRALHAEIAQNVQNNAKPTKSAKPHRTPSEGASATGRRVKKGAKLP